MTTRNSHNYNDWLRANAIGLQSQLGVSRTAYLLQVSEVTVRYWAKDRRCSPIPASFEVWNEIKATVNRLIDEKGRFKLPK